MEVADVVIINKCDGDNKMMAEIAKNMLKNALHILKPKYKEWQAQALTCSARDNTGIESIWMLSKCFMPLWNLMEKWH